MGTHSIYELCCVSRTVGLYLSIYLSIYKGLTCTFRARCYSASLLWALVLTWVSPPVQDKRPHLLEDPYSTPLPVKGLRQGRTLILNHLCNMYYYLCWADGQTMSHLLTNNNKSVYTVVLIKTHTSHLYCLSFVSYQQDGRENPHTSVNNSTRPDQSQRGMRN